MSKATVNGTVAVIVPLVKRLESFRSDKMKSGNRFGLGRKIKEQQEAFIALMREKNKLHEIEMLAREAKEHKQRLLINATVYRRRLFLDQDNLDYSFNKLIIDPLVRMKILPGDRTDQIKCEVIQERVAKGELEGVGMVISREHTAARAA